MNKRSKITNENASCGAMDAGQPVADRRVLITRTVLIHSMLLALVGASLASGQIGPIDDPYCEQNPGSLACLDPADGVSECEWWAGEDYRDELKNCDELYSDDEEALEECKDQAEEDYEDAMEDCQSYSVDAGDIKTKDKPVQLFARTSVAQGLRITNPGCAVLSTNASLHGPSAANSTLIGGITPSNRAAWRLDLPKNSLIAIAIQPALQMSLAAN